MGNSIQIGHQKPKITTNPQMENKPINPAQINSAHNQIVQNQSSYQAGGTQGSNAQNFELAVNQKTNIMSGQGLDQYTNSITQHVAGDPPTPVKVGFNVNGTLKQMTVNGVKLDEEGKASYLISCPNAKGQLKSGYITEEQLRTGDLSAFGYGKKHDLKFNSLTPMGAASGFGNEDMPMSFGSSGSSTGGMSKSKPKIDHTNINKGGPQGTFEDDYPSNNQVHTSGIYGNPDINED